MNSQIKYFKIKSLNFNGKIDNGFCLLDVLFNIGNATTDDLKECLNIL